MLCSCITSRRPDVYVVLYVSTKIQWLIAIRLQARTNFTVRRDRSGSNQQAALTLGRNGSFRPISCPCNRYINYLSLSLSVAPHSIGVNNCPFATFSVYLVVSPFFSIHVTLIFYQNLVPQFALIWSFNLLRLRKYGCCCYDIVASASLGIAMLSSYCFGFHSCCVRAEAR